MGGWKNDGQVDKLFDNYKHIAPSRAVLPGNKAFAEKVKFCMDFLFGLCLESLCTLTEKELAVPGAR